MSTTLFLQVEIGTMVKLLVGPKACVDVRFLISFFFCVELVLRRPNGSFYPIYWLMSTLCHEVRSESTSNFAIQDLTLSCSQLAHIQAGFFLLTQVRLVLNWVNLQQHMNHGPAFQALWACLRVEVRQLQARGYYGDGNSRCIISTLISLRNPCQTGFWSSGTRLRDLARVGGEGLESGDFPEYVVRTLSLLRSC